MTFDRLLDTFEADLDAAVASGSIEPGCNMPSIGYSEKHPRLFAYTVESVPEGLISALGDEAERKSDPRYKHLVFFPSWSMGELVFVRVPDGEKVWIEATSDSDLEVTLESGATIATTKEQILVVFHGSLDFEAVKAFYQEP